MGAVGEARRHQRCGLSAGRKIADNPGSDAPGVNSVQVEISRHEIPLKTPYVLSFDTLLSITTYLVRIRAHQRIGLGEITPLPGYSNESSETVESLIDELANDHRNFAGLKDLRTWAEKNLQTHPFAATGFLTAVESWDDGPDVLASPVERPIPIVGVPGGSSPAAAAEDAGHLVMAGHGILKVKVGLDLRTDLERVRAIASRCAGRARLRLDANQSYKPEEAAHFCTSISDLPIALFEQPFPAGMWEENAKLIQVTRIPIMLDESIRGPADIDRAVSVGCAWVKFKLCKHGGVERTKEMVRLARRKGLFVIIGNGVQTELGCHLEARVWADCRVDTAGEMNGFAKLARPLLPHRLRISGGNLRDSGIGKDGCNLEPLIEPVQRWRFTLSSSSS